MTATAAEVEVNASDSMLAAAGHFSHQAPSSQALHVFNYLVSLLRLYRPKPIFKALSIS